MRRVWPVYRRLLAQLLAGALLVSCGSPEPLDDGGDPVSASIASPASNATFHGGSVIQFSGSGTGPDGAALPGSALSWWVELHFDGQTDLAMPVTTGASGSFTVPSTGITSSNIFYRLFLRAAVGGEADTVSRDILPETMQLTLASLGAGRSLTLDGTPQVAPFTVTAVVGMQREVGAPSPQTANDSTYTFQSWSDAGSATHTIIPPAVSATYTATFAVSGPAPAGPPTAVITTPLAGSTYRGGQLVSFSGSAQDGSGAAIPASSLSWWIDFHHDGITDPFLVSASGASGNVTIPTTGPVTTNAFYRLFLRAVDSHGVADTVSRDISPQTMQLTVTSSPVGRNVSLDGANHTAPFTATAVVGIVRQIGATSPQTQGDSTYTFQSWSDGGGQNHTISPPTGNTTYTASFSASGPPPVGEPVATITAPASGATYRAGNTINFSGTGTSGTGSALPGSALTWWVEFHHNGQTDTVKAPAAGSGSNATGSYPVPTVETSANVFYRFFLVALDNGVADTVFRDVLPQTVQLTFTSAPAGRTLTVDGVNRTAPYVVTGVIGVVRSIGLTSPQSSNDSTFTFATWSDGGAQNHNVTTPAGNTTYTANFSVVPPQPPTATITAPAANATYRGGSTISFVGTAVDMHGTAITGTSLSWWAELHHDTHTHPFMPVTPGGSGSTVIPTTGEVSSNVFYRFYFRAVDSRGLADTVFTDVQPEKIQLTIASNPTGRTIALDGQPQTAPYTVTGVVGIVRALGVVSPQSGNDTSYTWSSWSDGGTQSHTISTPISNTTYTATFTATGPANQPPTVAITAPAAGASIVVNTATPVNATASDPDGSVTQVEFFDGGTSLGVDASSPYSINWTPTVIGPHSLTARATDNDGDFTNSAAVALTVINGGGGDTQAPTVTLTSPQDGTTGLTGVLTATADASDNVGVVGVEFQLDGVTIGEDTSAPYSLAMPTLANYASGPHQVRARARDAAGNRSVWARARISSGGSVAQPAGFTRTVIPGLDQLSTAMAFAPDGRLFVCQQDGDLRVIKNGVLLSTPFLHAATNQMGEQGLLGVAFHPNFNTNHFVYIYYTVNLSGTPHNRISRFTANGDVAVAASESVLVELPNLSGATNHNGGAIHFGPDGKLYVAVGDNANGLNAQSVTTRLGKVLRYNDDGSIPSDNPGLGTGVNAAIWAMGFRNPFTFSFQPGTGRMFINDVGEETWEEINQGVAGANYGWPTTEGATSNPSFTSPLFTYRHGGTPAQNPSLVSGFAIVGSAFYNPSTSLFPAEYAGNYFFADYVNHWVYRLDLAAGDDAVYAFANLPNSITDLAVGPDGALYVLGAQPNDLNVVWRFAPP